MLQRCVDPVEGKEMLLEIKENVVIIAAQGLWWQRCFGMGSTGPLLMQMLKILCENVKGVRDLLSRHIYPRLHSRQIGRAHV